MKNPSIQKFKSDIAHLSPESVMFSSLRKGTNNFLFIKTPLKTEAYSWTMQISPSEINLVTPDELKRLSPFFVIAINDGTKQLYVLDTGPDIDESLLFGKGKHKDGLAIFINKDSGIFKIMVCSDVNGKHEHQLATATSDIQVPLIIKTILEAYGEDFEDLQSFNDMGNNLENPLGV